MRREKGTVTGVEWFDSKRGKILVYVRKNAYGFYGLEMLVY